MSDWEDYCEANGWNVGSADDYESFLDSLEDNDSDIRQSSDKDHHRRMPDRNQSLLILENLLTRIEKESMSLSYVTSIEYDALRTLQSQFDAESTDKESRSTPIIDDFDDDIPF